MPQDTPTFSNVTPGGVFDGDINGEFASEQGGVFEANAEGPVGPQGDIGNTGPAGPSYDTVMASITGADVTLTFSDSTDTLSDQEVMFTVPVGHETAQEVLDSLNAYTGASEIPDSLIPAAITRDTELATVRMALEAAIALKQDILTFDTTPVQNSANPVTSGGVYSAIANINTGGGTSTIDGNPVTAVRLIPAGTDAGDYAIIITLNDGTVIQSPTVELAVDLSSYYTSAQTDTAIAAIISQSVDNGDTTLVPSEDAVYDFVTTQIAAEDTSIRTYIDTEIAGIVQDVAITVADETARNAVVTTDLLKGQLLIQEDTSEIYYLDADDGDWSLLADLGIQNIEDLNDVILTIPRADLVTGSILVWDPSGLEEDGSAGTWTQAEKEAYIDSSTTVEAIRQSILAEVATRTSEDARIEALIAPGDAAVTAAFQAADTAQTAAITTLITDGDTTVITESRATDAAIRTEFAAVDTAIRAEFAAADTAAFNLLTDNYHIDDDQLRADFTAADVQARLDFETGDAEITRDYQSADTALQDGIDANTDLIQDNYIANSRIETTHGETILNAEVYSTFRVDELLTAIQTSEVLFLYSSEASFADARATLENRDISHVNGVYTSTIIADETGGTAGDDRTAEFLNVWHATSIAGDRFSIEGVNHTPGDPIAFQVIQLGTPGLDGQSTTAIFADDAAGTDRNYDPGSGLNRRRFVAFYSSAAALPATALDIPAGLLNFVEYTGPQGDQGFEGPFLVYLYQSIAEGLDAPDTAPIATFSGSDPSDISLFGDLGTWTPNFTAPVDGVNDVYTSFALYNPAIDLLGDWVDPFQISDRGPPGPPGPAGQQLEVFDPTVTYTARQFIITDPGNIAYRLTDATGPVTEPTETNSDWIVNLADPNRIENITTTHLSTGLTEYVAFDNEGLTIATWTTGGGSTPTPGAPHFTVSLNRHTVTAGADDPIILTLNATGTGIAYTGHGAFSVASSAGGTPRAIVSGTTNTVTIFTGAMISAVAAGTTFTITGQINYTDNGTNESHMFSVTLQVATAPAHIYYWLESSGTVPTAITDWVDTGITAVLNNASPARFMVDATANTFDQHVYFAIPTSVVGAQTAGTGTTEDTVQSYIWNRFGELRADDGDGWNSINGGDITPPTGYQVYVSTGPDALSTFYLEER